MAAAGATTARWHRVLFLLAYMGSVSGEAYITKFIETRFSIYRRGNIPPEIGSGSPFSVRIPPPARRVSRLLVLHSGHFGIILPKKIVGHFAN